MPDEFDQAEYEQWLKDCQEAEGYEEWVAECQIAFERSYSETAKQLAGGCYE